MKARGFALVSAIFILVVLAALGAFMLSVSSSQQIGSALDVQGVRAYQAARAGIEWGLYRQLRENYCAGGVQTNSFQPGAAAFAGFTVTVVCTPTADPGGFGGPTVYRLEATACNQPDGVPAACPNTNNPGQFYVERRLDVSF